MFFYGSFLVGYFVVFFPTDDLLGWRRTGSLVSAASHSPQTLFGHKLIIVQLHSGNENEISANRLTVKRGSNNCRMGMKCSESQRGGKMNVTRFQGVRPKWQARVGQIFVVIGRIV